MASFVVTRSAEYAAHTHPHPPPRPVLSLRPSRGRVVFPFLAALSLEVTIDGSRVEVHHTDEKEPHPLALHHVPICVTFAIFEVRSVSGFGLVWFAENRDRDHDRSISGFSRDAGG